MIIILVPTVSALILMCSILFILRRLSVSNIHSTMLLESVLPVCCCPLLELRVCCTFLFVIYMWHPGFPVNEIFDFLLLRIQSYREYPLLSQE